LTDVALGVFGYVDEQADYCGWKALAAYLARVG